MIRYFANGSNMLPARLLARCPSAQMVETVTASDHALTFWKRGQGPSGKATLVHQQGAVTPGILYTLSRDDLEKLNGDEKGYTRHDTFSVRSLDGTKIHASTYIADQTDPALIPFDWYLDLCTAGARHHGLGTDHIPTACCPDPDPDRKARLKALALLGRAD